MTKKAIITGVSGQSGSYLAEYLLGLGYEVYGVYRRVSTGNNFDNIAAILNNPRFHLYPGDICDYPFMFQLIDDIKPDEFYNLAAASHVGQSFSEPTVVFRTNAEAVIAQLDAIRKFSPKTRYLQASTSEMHGTSFCPPEGWNEDSPFYPRSPYAVAKVAAHNAVRNYRERKNDAIYSCASICHNHESPRRGMDFVTKKITHGVASVKLGLQQHVELGNLKAYRDWGHAKDYVQAQHLILQQDEPEDYVVATGQPASVRDALEYVCQEAGLDFDDVYRQNPKYMRPSDVPYMKGDATKLRNLGWRPNYNWKSLLTEMYYHDLDLLKG